MTTITDVEHTALDWLANPGWQVVGGSQFDPSCAEAGHAPRRGCPLFFATKEVNQLGRTKYATRVPPLTGLLNS